ncbi:GNAT family N-acetyltransferase [Nocardia sp. KC 131]|uniref:GNAT family N-acetyltransferase n=1 Tax=Nocardia arseniciresistens TaxID=3392119 RepID=UPI00398F3CC8
MPVFERATADDRDDIVKALVEGTCTNHRRLARKRTCDENDSIRRLRKDMYSRKYDEYDHILAGGKRNDQPVHVFVARCDGEFVGFIEVGLRKDGSGQMYSWHLAPEWRGRHMGVFMMRHALEYFPPGVPVYSNATKNTVAARMHGAYHFKEHKDPNPKLYREARRIPPPHINAEIASHQVPYIQTYDNRLRALEHMDTSIKVLVRAGIFLPA